MLNFDLTTYYNEQFNKLINDFRNNGWSFNENPLLMHRPIRYYVNPIKKNDIIRMNWYPGILKYVKKNDNDEFYDVIEPWIHCTFSFPMMYNSTFKIDWDPYLNSIAILLLKEFRQNNTIPHKSELLYKGYFTLPEILGKYENKAFRTDVSMSCYINYDFPEGSRDFKMYR